MEWTTVGLFVDLVFKCEDILASSLVCLLREVDTVGALWLAANQPLLLTMNGVHLLEGRIFRHVHAELL